MSATLFAALPSAPWPPRTRRDLIEHAKAAYIVHGRMMAQDYPHLAPQTPWDEQDAAVREAWIEHVTPEEYDAEHGLRRPALAVSNARSRDACVDAALAAGGLSEHERRPGSEQSCASAQDIHTSGGVEPAPLTKTLRAILKNANSYHAGEDGKQRALNVIGSWARDALDGRLHPSMKAIVREDEVDV